MNACCDPIHVRSLSPAEMQDNGTPVWPHLGGEQKLAVAPWAKPFTRFLEDTPVRIILV